MDTAQADPADPSVSFRTAVPSIGDTVELRQHDATIRVGEVESAMPDGSGFWLAAHGADTRIYVPTADDALEIRISRPLTSLPGDFGP